MTFNFRQNGMKELKEPVPFKDYHHRDNDPQMTVEMCALSSDTNEVHSKPTLRFVVNENLKAQFLAIHDTMMKQNDLIDDEGKALKGRLSTERILTFLEDNDQGDGYFEYWAIKWKHDQFVTTRIRVKYGNCTLCGTARALGEFCLTRGCGGTRQASTIYYVKDYDVHRQPGHMPQYGTPPPTLAGQPTASPWGISYLYNKTPAVYFDTEFLHEKN